ncbi:MAG TPA: single-stranded DNA-binding protein [Phycisphaerae bacterium]|nr:single-stranded DNA-binding protein [Phycisphaerae bacterium]
MAAYNKVILVGNLTRDPQMSYLPSQTPVTEIGLAVNHRWRGKDGQQREDVCFIDCRCYGPQAENLNKYVRKGSPILIEGRLELDTWEGKDGQKRSKHRIFVERFQFLGGAPAGAARAPAASAPPAPAPPAAFPAQPDDAPGEPPPYDDGQEGPDIPF